MAEEKQATRKISALQIHITANCRRVHGQAEAFNIAVAKLKKEYDAMVEALPGVIAHLDISRWTV